MFPIVLDTKIVRIVLIGDGPLADKRRIQLAEAGAEDLRVFKTPPPRHELERAQIVYVVDLPEKDAKSVADTCRELGVLVNVEDVIPLCDFHTPSQVRRGSLLLSVSTGGKSPGLARRLRKYLELRVTPDWDEKLEILAEKRRKWRDEGLSLKEVAQKTNDLIDEKGWLPMPSSQQKDDG